MRTETHECECDCGCTAESAWQEPDSGCYLCDTCSDYYVTDNGDVVCSRVQGEKTCRHCKGDIEWGSIQTRQWRANWREGRCSCRSWTQADHGGHWVLSEGENR
jgi:hypothetical protein